MLGRSISYCDWRITKPAQRLGTSSRSGGRVRTKGIVALVTFLACTASGCLAAWAAEKEQVVGLRRLSEQEYRNSIADIFGRDIAVQGMFEPGVRMGGLIAASSAVLSMTQPGFESFSKMADGIAIQVTSEKLRGK